MSTMALIKEEVLYWATQLGYEIINVDEFVQYCIDNYIRTKEEVIDNYIEIMEIKVPYRECLDEDWIIENDDDYVKINSNTYLNLYYLETNDVELKRENLIK